MENEWYETPEQIVDDYYSGKLEETYPMLVVAINMILCEALVDEKEDDSIL
jgi:hypothetical protein